jgi:hypothetical protein
MCFLVHQMIDKVQKHSFFQLLFIICIIYDALFQNYHLVLQLHLCQHLFSHHLRNNSSFQNHTVRVLQASRHEPIQWHWEGCTPSQRRPPLHPLQPTLANHRRLKGRQPPLLWRNPKGSNPLHLLKHLGEAGNWILLKCVCLVSIRVFIISEVWFPFVTCRKWLVIITLII